jgi:hypothetical protein
LHDKLRAVKTNNNTKEQSKTIGRLFARQAKSSSVTQGPSDKDFGATRFPYELGSGVNPFAGGYFEHREWPIRRVMELHASLRPFNEYEAHHVNAVGYWMAFSSSAMYLRDRALNMEGQTGVAEAQLYDVWSMMAVQYGLRTLGLRVEFYKRSAKDPMHARLIMPALEGHHDVAATDDLDERT